MIRENRKCSTNKCCNQGSEWFYHLLQLRLGTWSVAYENKGHNVYRIRNSYRKLRTENAHKKFVATKVMVSRITAPNLDSIYCQLLTKKKQKKTPCKGHDTYKTQSSYRQVRIRRARNHCCNQVDLNCLQEHQAKATMPNRHGRQGCNQSSGLPPPA